MNEIKLANKLVKKRLLDKGYTEEVCPECLTEGYIYTARYLQTSNLQIGALAYYKCTECKVTFISLNSRPLEIPAPDYELD